MKRSRSLSLVLALAAPMASATAWAQAEADTFALNRYNPSERGSDWFANESVDLRGHQRPFLGLVGDWAYKPLVLYDNDTGDETTAIVRQQAYAHLGGGVILWDHVRLAASAPLLVRNVGDSEATATGTFASQDSTSFGDLRLGADVRLVGIYEDPFTLAIGAQLHLPTGNQDAYAGDGNVRLQPHLLGAGDIGPLAYAAQVSVAYRPNSGELNGTPFGSEATFAVAGGLRLLDRRLLIGPEVFGSTVIGEGGAAFDRLTTPLEIIFGGKYLVTRDIKVGAGVGPGLTRGLGSPKVRALVSLEWIPASDRDNDGIIDELDACPDVPGKPNPDPAKHGCPPSDRDGDTIFDDDDACPDEPGPANADPKKHGCPLRDRDGDTILDDDDACPDEPGPPNADPKKHGCPPRDRDGDTIFDDDDACPDEPGPPNADPTRNGCPLARVQESQIVIYDRVEFEFDKAVLRPQSNTVLDAVKAILDAHPEFTRISIEGHTDNEGTEEYNQNLSEERAAAVVEWMINHGIDRSRLTSRGFGELRAIDTNETPAGRQNNRRVEFHILERNGEPVPRVDPILYKQKALQDEKSAAPAPKAPTP